MGDGAVVLIEARPLGQHLRNQLVFPLPEVAVVNVDLDLPPARRGSAMERFHHVPHSLPGGEALAVARPVRSAVLRGGPA